MKSIECKPPERSGAYSAKTRGHKSVFLAGSIEMGKAVDWQTDIVSRFPDGVTFLNPRRDDWDSSWVQKIDNPQFNEQVTWELDNLAAADIIFLYFAPGTQSPISLLELGLFAKENKNMIVCCPEGFWRKGNVDIVCKRYGIIVHDYIDTAILALQAEL